MNAGNSNESQNPDDRLTTNSSIRYETFFEPLTQLLERNELYQIARVATGEF